MASTPKPAILPGPGQSGKPDPKKQIDIPYNRTPNRLRRAAKSFIKWTIIFSIISFVAIFASQGDVELGLVLSSLEAVFGIAIQILTLLMGIVLQFGLLFWFLSRPKVEIIKPGDDTTVTFDDYWGQPQLVALVKQWMSLLRDRKDFEKMGGKYISGLLLYGPPGTGKTMLAKAIAGESGMAFLSALGTSFQGMFWGMDILMVLRFSKWSRDLAKKYGACVAYIDEIDAIGMNRGGVRGGAGGGPGMMTGGMGMGLGMFALSTLLSQMDGMNGPSRGDKFKTKLWKLFGKKYVIKRNWHVMWMGSTNRPDVLDPALTRSGRLDTKIEVSAPDRASRRLIIKGYLSRIKHDDSVDVEAIVADTAGMTPADIAGAITKDAVRIAFFDGRKLVAQKDINRAFMEQQDGMEMPLEEFDEDQRRVLAYHEAGHAVAMYYMAPEEKILRATINPLSSGVKGYVQSIDTVDQHVTPVKRIVYRIIISFAGRGAEKILSGEPYQSVGGDYPSVRGSLWMLIENGYFGPPIVGGPFGSSYDQYARDKEETLKRYWERMEDTTEKFLRRHWSEVMAVAEELLEKRTLSGNEVIAVIEANQNADSLSETEIIPKTLAAIRAQTVAEMNKKSGRLIEQPNSVINQDEQVVVLNGAGNGVYGAGPAAAPATPPPATPAQDAPRQADGEPRMISGGLGDYQPQVVNNGGSPSEPEQKS
jgi:cell division protease FtsH